MQRCSVVAQPVQRLLDVRLELGECGNGCVLARVAVGRDDVELRPVARRKTDRFAARCRKPRRERRRMLAVERDALPQLHGRVMVRGADEDETHQEK